VEFAGHRSRFNPDDIAMTRTEPHIDTELLAKWLNDNYIRQCAEGCPGYVQRLLCNVGVAEDNLRIALPGIIQWKWEAMTEKCFDDITVLMVKLYRDNEALKLGLETANDLLSEIRHFPVMILPPLGSFMEIDVTLIYALSRVVADCCHCEYIDDAASVYQLTLSLYLVLQCRISLKHPTSQIADDMRRIKMFGSKLDQRNKFHDRLLLSFIYRKAMIHVNKASTEDR
jgi:hypothetical protein